MRLLARLVTGAYEETMHGHGIRIGQMNLLVAVAAGGPVTPGELGRRMVLEKSTVSRDVKILMNRGWLSSEPGSDGRSHRLTITPAGLAAIDEAYPAWVEGQRAAERLLGRALAESASSVVNRRWGMAV